MSEPYTPTTDTVRCAYLASETSFDDFSGGLANAEFDRWLAQHDKEVLKAASIRAMGAADYWKDGARGALALAVAAAVLGEGEQA